MYNKRYSKVETLTEERVFIFYDDDMTCAKAADDKELRTFNSKKSGCLLDCFSHVH